MPKQQKLPSCYPVAGCLHLRRRAAIGVLDARGNTHIVSGPQSLAVCPACNDWLVAMELGQYAEARSARPS